MKPSTDYPQLIQKFIADEKLPAHYADDAITWFLPLKEQISSQVKARARSLYVVGINGAQGTGKSTLAALIQRLLQADGLTVVSLSLDDFYLSSIERQHLARDIHPLLRSRGVPGTHDVKLALNTIETLRSLSDIEQLVLPGFNKATDDPFPIDECLSIHGPVDVLILEGWFTGIGAQSMSELQDPINQLEREEDSDGTWRSFVNDSLAADYQTLFANIDWLVMLKAPSFEKVYEWRSLQESKLKARHGDGKGIMSEADLARFIQHFERLTRHCLSQLPHRAQLVLELDEQHRIQKPSA